jgi:ankyrin repeat protein
MQHKLCVMSLIMLWISVAVIVCLCQAAQPSDLFSLVAREDVEGIEALVASKPALLNKAGSGGQTPLMSAVLSGKAKAVEVLLKSGADVTIGEQDGYTPMVRLHLHTNPWQ